MQLVSPGGWLCDLTLERYEVREKKVSKKVCFSLIPLFDFKFKNFRKIVVVPAETKGAKGYGKRGLRF